MQTSVYKSFADIPSRIATLLTLDKVKSTQHSLDWFRCLHETSFPNDHCPRIYCVEDSSTNLCLVLFADHAPKSRHLKGLTNFYTTEFGPLENASGTQLEQAYDALAQYILCEQPSWQTIEFRYIDQKTVDSSTLLERLTEAGFYFYNYPLYDNWYTVLDDLSFTEYYERRSSRVKNTIRRKGKKLQAAYHCEIKYFEKNDEHLPIGVSDYTQVYNSSWKSPEPFPDFIPRFAEFTADYQTLLLGVLYLDSKPVAAQFWNITSHKALIYKLAYDEKFSNLSPGSYLSEQMFKRVIDEHRPYEIDYGIGSEKYKQEWMDECRTVYCINGYNRKTLYGNLLAVIHKCRLLVKIVLSKANQLKSQ